MGSPDCRRFIIFGCFCLLGVKGGNFQIKNIDAHKTLGLSNVQQRGDCDHGTQKFAHVLSSSKRVAHGMGI
jgi:hypothetical protein